MLLNSSDFAQMVSQICPTELQLNKANPSDTEAPFLDLDLSIINGIVSTKIYDIQDNFNFEKVNFPFLNVGVPRFLPMVYTLRTYSFCKSMFSC